MRSWNDVVIGIPTMPQRAGMLEQLLQAVGRECPEAVWVVRGHVPGDPPSVDFPALWREVERTIKRFPQPQSWTLFLEDDIWLAPGFGLLALDAMREAEERKVDSVSLFSRRKVDLETMRHGRFYREQRPSLFWMMQAVFVRTAAMEGFDSFARQFYINHPEHVHAADLLLGTWLSARGSRMLVRVPSLVQHRRGPSTLPGGRARARQSETYRIAYGEVPGEETV